MTEHLIAPTEQQDRALRDLVAGGTLNQHQADAVRQALWSGRPARPSGVLTEVAGYVGGALMLGGAVLLIGLNWSRFNRAQEIALLAGVALALVVAGLLVAGGPRGLAAVRGAAASVRRRLVGLLLPLSAVPAALAVGVASPRPHELLLGSTAGLVVALLMYALLPSVPGLLIAAGLSGFTAWGAAQETQPAYREALWPHELFIVAELTVVGLAWGVAAVTRLASPRRLGLAVAAFYVILGAQTTVDSASLRPLGYVLTALAGAACVVLYWWERATVLLAAAVIALSVVVLEVVNQVTHNAVAGPLGLLVGGAVLVGASVLGFWVRAVRERTA